MKRTARWAVAIIACAGGIAVAWWGTGAATHGEVRLITGTVRGLDGRISYPAADVYRPYQDRRGAAQPLAEVSMETLAELERRGDFHGVAAGLLLSRDLISGRAALANADGTRAASGTASIAPRVASLEPATGPAGHRAAGASPLPRDLERADAYLGRAPPSPDVASDRALLLRAAGQSAAALIALDGVLELAPGHPQALWNRALVLADLGLPLSAAAGFAAVAALNEPGWSAEAHARARALADAVAERKAAYRRLAFTDGPRLATAPDGVTADLARRFPGVARLMLYDAVRSAESAAAVRALEPLAATLDGVYGGEVLVAYIARVAAADFARRGPLARQYAALRAGRLDAAAVDPLLAALRAGRQPDLLFGAVVLANPAGVPSAMVPELRGLADGLRDPWFSLLAAELAGKALVADGRYAAAEVALLPAARRCATSTIAYRCANVALALGESYLRTQRQSLARQVLTEGWLRAQRGGEWYLEPKFLWLLTQLEASQDDVVGSTLPLVRAYTGELTLRDPEQCYLAAWSHDERALLYVNRVDLARARDELAMAAAAQRACPDAAPSVQRLFAQAHVLRAPGAGSADEVAAVRADLAALRAQATRPGPRAMIDHIEGRLLIDRDRATGTALLERAIATSREAPVEDADARKARSYSYSVLTLDAGRAADWDRVWQRIGDDAGFAVPARCALGLAVEDAASVAVVRDAAGHSQGVFDAARSGPEIAAAALVPPRLRDALRGCAEVEVVARPPAQGLPGLLPDELAWSYRVAGARGEPSTAVPRRVVIANTEPPAELGMPALLPWQSTDAPDLVLTGKAATPSRALAALRDASFVEIHSHGMVNAGESDASFLMLSPDSDGQYALTAGAIRGQPLRARPVVVLGACHAAVTATYRHELWSLPAAFLAAGARAVIASTDVVADRDANAFFDQLRARIEHGSSPAGALHDVRLAWLAAHPGAVWVRSLMVFQ